MANLRIIVNNDRPVGEEKNPRIWLLYKGKDTIEVHVTHDSQNRRLCSTKVPREVPRS